MTTDLCQCTDPDRKTEILPSRIWGCSDCKLPLDYSNSVQNTGDSSSETRKQENTYSQRTSTPASTKNREQVLVENLINQLARTEKYNRAINQGEFATFSIIGTNDWEDYASLSFQALQLRGMIRLEQAIATQNDLLRSISGQLETLVASQQAKDLKVE